MISTLGTSQSIFKFNQSSTATVTPYVFNYYTSATLPSVTTSDGFINLQCSKSGQYIYVSHSKNGLYKSSDSGTTYSLISGISGTSGNACQRVACSNDGSVVYILIGTYGGNNDVFKSTNYGVNWSKVSTTSSVLYQLLDCDGTGTYAIWGIYGNSIFYYGNNGSTVLQSINDTGCGWINVSMSKDSSYIVVGGNGKGNNGVNGTAKVAVSTVAYSSNPSWTYILNGAFDLNIGLMQQSYIMETSYS